MCRGNVVSLRSAPTMNVAVPFRHCAYCVQPFSTAEVEAHQAWCPRNTVDCEGCGRTVPTHALRHHLRSCGPSGAPSLPAASGLISRSPTLAAMMSAVAPRLVAAADRTCAAGPGATPAPAPSGAGSALVVAAWKHPCVSAPDVAPLPGPCSACGARSDDLHRHRCRARVVQCPRCRATVDAAAADRHMATCLREHYREIGWRVQPPRDSAAVVVAPGSPPPSAAALLGLSAADLPPPSPIARIAGPSSGDDKTEKRAAIKNGAPPLPPELRLCVLCEKIVRRDAFWAHLDVCESNVRSCEFCGDGVPVARYDEHVPQCPRNLRECYVCRATVVACELATHMQRCTHGGKTIKMFHGTSLENARAILRGGFKASTQGLLGAGVYLSRDMEKARRYGDVVVEAVVKVWRVAVIDRPAHRLQRCWHAHGYDAAWVPPHCGVVRSGLEEHCVYDPARIGVLGMHTPH